MKRLEIFYNPVSGGFRERRLLGLVAAFEAEGFAVSARETPADQRRIESDADLICIHGGDGALRDMVAALGDAAGRIPLCIAPSGTINLVARELGYSQRPRKFAAQIAAAVRRGPERWLRSPLFKLGDVPIVSCLSIGPDSHAVARVSSSLKKRIGRYAYVVAVMQQMREWPRQTMRVKGRAVSGEDFAFDAEAVIVSRGALYAGPFQLSPRAALAQEHCELITIRRPSRFGTLLFSLAALTRLPLERFGLSETRSVCRVEFDRCVTPVQVDGDHMPDCAYAIAPSGLTLTYVI